MSREPDLDGFVSYLTQVRAKSPRTAEAYRSDLAAYWRYCRGQKLDLTAALTRAQVGLYLVRRTAGDARRTDGSPRLSQRSAARAVSAIAAYCRYEVANGRLGSDPLKGFRAPKYSRKLPPYYSVSEIASVIRAFDDDLSALGRRNRALVFLLYSTGIRVGECETLDVPALNLGAQMALVRGKGNKQRMVPFGRPALDAVQAYLELARPVLAGPQSGAALFLSKSGRRLSARAIQQLLDRAALQAGLGKALSPHKLRHAYATHMLEGGADVRLLQELLGHESLNTTQQYTKVTRTMLRDVYLDSHPRAVKKTTPER